MEGRKRLGFALMFLAAVVLCAAAGFGIGRLQLPGQGVNAALTVSGATPGHVILSGNYTAGSSISIGKVATSVSLCVAATAPASCVNYFNDFFFNFTSATLGSPVAVASGQIVQVKVD